MSKSSIRPTRARTLVGNSSIRNPLARVCLYASKTDPRLVAVCSHWAISSQVAFGIFVLFTATLAFGGAYYMLRTLDVPASLSPWVALGWSTFIFFLDREIAGSFDKTTAVVRPFLALFIGTIVAIPIELYVFEQRIDQQLQRQYREDNRHELAVMGAKEAASDQARAGLRATLQDLERQDAEWAHIMDQELAGRVVPGRTGRVGAGPVFLNAQLQQSAIRRRLSEARLELERLERFTDSDLRRADARFHDVAVAKVANFVTRYEAMDSVIHTSRPLYRLSWIITLALILIEMTPALLKILTPQVDYHHLVRAEIRENVTRIDEISDRNYRLAIENPEVPRFSVAEKVTIVRYSPVDNVTPMEKYYAAKE